MKFKKALTLSSLLIFSGLSVVACNNNDNVIKHDEITNIIIKNKASLTKDFFIGDENRKIEISVEPSTIDVNKAIKEGKIIITSSNKNVIEIKEDSLISKGIGEALITVKANKVKDEIKIKVLEKEEPTPEPSIITDITINNKEELMAKFEVGDEERILDVSLTPSSFNFDEELEKGTIKIKNQNNRVIEIDGKTIKAKGKGTSIIEIESAIAYAEVTITVTEKVIPIENVTITNKEELRSTFRVGDLPREIKGTILPSFYDFDESLNNGLITLTSSDPSIIEIKGKTITPLKKGTSIITLKGMDKVDNVTINVLDKEVGTPTITLDTTKLYVMKGETLTLPKAKATSSEGSDLSSFITINDNKESTITDFKFSSLIEGEHSLIYEIKDPKDETKVAKAILKIEVCRKLFKEEGTKTFSVNELTEKENQSYKVNDSGQGTKAFNIAPSKLYYAEALIDMPQIGTNFWHGMAHFVNNQEPNYRWILDTIRNENDITHLYLDSSNWNASGDKWMFNINDTRDINIAPNDQKVKYAIARDGNTMYTFINDQFVTSYREEKYFNLDTTPGFFTNGQGKADFEMNATNIDFFDGTLAKEKIISLIGKDRTKLLTPYKNFGINEKNYLWEAFENEEKGLGYKITKVESDTQENGSCNCYNSPKNVVKVETLMTGSFKVNWDFILEETKPCEHKQEAHHNIDIRRWNYEGEIARLGLEKQTGFDSLKTWGGSGWGGEMNTEGFDFTLGYHFELVREIKEDKDLYTLSISSIKDRTQVITNTFDYTSGDKGEPIYILFHNDGVKGEVNNLNWENI